MTPNTLVNTDAGWRPPLRGFWSPAPVTSNISPHAHMYQCPSCNRRSFRFTAKLWSWVPLPAKCRECGESCFAPNSPSGVLLVFNTVLLGVAGFFAAYLYSSAPLALGAALAVMLWMFRLHIQPLIGLSDDQVTECRKREGLWLLVLMILTALR